MKKILFILISIPLIFISCEKDCNCESVVYESTIETGYEWYEISRESSKECVRDTMSSTFLDNNGNISYVNTIIECK